MMVRNWLYYLITESGACYLVQNGVVSTVPVPYPLRQTPDGWQQLLIGWERDMNHFGIVRNFSMPLSFFGDGAKILRHLYYSNGIEEKVYLLIQRFSFSADDNYYYPVHKYFYKGELDFSTFKDEEQKVSINIVEGGLSKLLKANENTVYEFDLSDPEAKDVTNDGIFLSEKHNFLILEGQYHNDHFLNITPTTKEGQANGFATTAVFGSGIPSGYNYQEGTDYLFAVSQNINDIRIRGTIRFTTPELPVWAAWLYTSTGRTIEIGVIMNTVSGQTYSWDFDVTFDAYEGEKFYFIADSPEFFFNTIYEETSFSIEFKSKYKPTNTRAFTPAVLFKKLIGKITGSEENADISYLQLFDRYMITSGDGIRGIPSAKVKTSLKDYLDAFKTILFAGLGIENGKVVVRELSYFFDSTNPIHLGRAKELTVSPANDLLYNSFRIGYQPEDIDDVNGRYEFNNSHLYTTPLTRVVKELNLVSAYNAQPYLIEITRINLEGKTTTDDKSDNKVFLLDVESRTITGYGVSGFILDGRYYLRIVNGDEFVNYFPSGGVITLSGGNINNGNYTVQFAAAIGGDTLIEVQQPVVAGASGNVTITTPLGLRRGGFDSITGVPDPGSIYNIELSPKRIAMKWAKWLNSILCGFAGQTMRFQTTEKNSELWTVKNNPPESIKENSDLGIGAEIMFKPCWMEFDTEVPIDLVEVLEATPHRPFTFEWNGILWKGFLFKGGMAPDDNKEQVFKLLAAPENDLTKLIV